MILPFEEVLSHTRQYIQKASGMHGALNVGATQAILDSLDMGEGKPHLHASIAINCLQILSQLQEVFDRETDEVNDWKNSPISIECNDLRRDLADTLLDYIENIIGDTE